MSYAVSGKIAGLGMTAGYYGQGRGPRPGSPYLYSGIRGLGDASYDAALAAYNSDHAAWVQEQAAYNRALQAFAGQSAAQNAAYASAVAGYNAAYANWQAQQAAYTQALALAEGAARGIVMGYASATTAAQKAYPALLIPSDYSGCVTQAQHDAWVNACASSNVKGIGSTPTGPACALAMLAVCQAMPALPASPPPAPVPPSSPASLAAPAPLRPEPQPPALPAPSPLTPMTTTMSTTPAAIPPSTTPTTPSVTQDPYAPVPVLPADFDPVIVVGTPTSAGILSNGLLLVVLAAGGYAVYCTLKKPRARAV